MKNRIILLITLSLLLCGCGQKPLPDASGSEPTDGATVEPSSSVIADPVAFTYSEISFPDTISQADGLFCCDQTADSVILSVGKQNGKPNGPTLDTTALAVCTLDGEVKSYPVETKAYITSAVLFQDAVYYVDYSQNEDATVSWKIVRTDGTQAENIVQGSADNYEVVPKLFRLDEELFYIWKESDTFGVKQIKDNACTEVFTMSDCSLMGIMGIDVAAAGDKFCFLADCPSEQYATFFICGKEGVISKHPLPQKPMHFAISEDYATCGIGDETTGKCAIFAVDLDTDEEITIEHPYGPIWCLRSDGSSCIGVTDNWIPYYVDITGKTFTKMPLPKHSESLGNILYYRTSPSRFFVMMRLSDHYQFYALTLG